jgi:hypothetical protein
MKLRKAYAKADESQLQQHRGISVLGIRTIVNNLATAWNSGL